MTQSIDFDGINAAALRDGRSFVQDLIPGGKFRSLEYIVRNPKRDDRHPGSFTINYKTGVWKDFATGDCGGDFISLFAFVRGYSQSDAARVLADRYGLPFFKPNGSPAPRPPNGGAATEAPRVYNWDDNGPAQRDEIRRHVYRREDQLARQKEEAHKGSSSPKRKRRGDAAQRKFDMVMAWSVDRLGRSLQDARRLR